MSEFPSVIISNDALKKLKSGELWFTKYDIVGRRPAIAGIVVLLDRRRNFVGMAFLSPDSVHYLRCFSLRRENADKEFWRLRLKKAYERRGQLLSVTNSFRVVHAEADGIPSVVIDKYDNIWSFQIGAEGAKVIREDLINIIIKDFSPVSIIEKGKIVFGSKRVATVKEGSEKYELDVLSGQKTGAYLDYRSFRLKARELARGDSLDAFCYQGWFSCQIAPFAKKVVAIDSSLEAITAAKKNSILNNHKNIEFIKMDVFDFLKQCKDLFDFIHLDPPSFAKGGSKVQMAVRGYQKLIFDALKCLKDDGIIFVSSCSHNITENILEKTVTDCMKKANMKYECVFRGIQDKDHPILKGFPQSLYLKAIAFRV